MNKARRIKTLVLGLLMWCAGALILWFTLPYKPRAVLSAPEQMTVAAFAPNGKSIATKSKTVMPAIKGPGVVPDEWNGPIRIWDVDTGKQIGFFPEEGELIKQV